MSLETVVVLMKKPIASWPLVALEREARAKALDVEGCEGRPPLAKKEDEVNRRYCVAHHVS